MRVWCCYRGRRGLREGRQGMHLAGFRLPGVLGLLQLAAPGKYSCFRFGPHGLGAQGGCCQASVVLTHFCQGSLIFSGKNTRAHTHAKSFTEAVTPLYASPVTSTLFFNRHPVVDDACRGEKPGGAWDMGCSWQDLTGVRRKRDVIRRNCSSLPSSSR